MRRRYAAFLALCVLVVIASGAVLTTLRLTATTAQYVHLRAGVTVGVLSFVLGVWCLSDRHPLPRWLGLCVAVTAGVEAIPGAVLIHACFAPVLFTAVTAVALFRPVKPQACGPGQGSLRYLVLSLPPLVFVQIALGAAYRHKVTGVMPHMGGAMLVAGLILVVCVLLLQRYPSARPLRSLAVALVSVVLCQVTLGIFVLILRLLDLDTSRALVVAAAAHVCVGASTLAISTQLAIQYQRSVA